jgi:hypothetical protein
LREEEFPEVEREMFVGAAAQTGNEVNCERSNDSLGSVATSIAVMNVWSAVDALSSRWS